MRLHSRATSDDARFPMMLDGNHIQVSNATYDNTFIQNDAANPGTPLNFVVDIDYTKFQRTRPRISVVT